MKSYYSQFYAYADSKKNESMKWKRKEDLIQWGYDYLRNSNKTEFDFDEDQHVEIIWR